MSETNSTYKPLTRDMRRRTLQDIRAKEDDYITKQKMPRIAGLDSVMKVYKIPLNSLVYNPINSRFATKAETYKTKYGELDSENPDHISLIEKLIWEYKLTKNEKTIESLLENGQISPGVVTVDGVILSGNRRFRMLNEIAKNADKYSNYDPAMLNHFEAVIIDRELDKQEIQKLESFFQYGQDEKVEYGPIEKYLAVKRQADEDIPPNVIYKNFQAIAKDEKKIKEWLETFTLMDAYLVHIGEPKIYTALYHSGETSREEQFLSLNGNINTLNKGTAASVRNSWDYGPLDIADFKIVVFDYIHKYVTVTESRKIFPIFLDEQRWKPFVKNHKAIMSSSSMKSLDDYRHDFPTADIVELAEMRERDFKNTYEEQLNKAFNAEFSKLEQLEEEQRPLKLIEKIIKNLSELEEVCEASKFSDRDKDSIIKGLLQVQKTAGALKQDID